MNAQVGVVRECIEGRTGGATVTIRGRNEIVLWVRHWEGWGVRRPRCVEGNRSLLKQLGKI